MRLPLPHRAEAPQVQALCERLAGALDWSAAARRARPWIESARRHPPPFWALESLLREYPISSAEGLALMRLAESLLRVPDIETAVALTADQLRRADFATAHGDGALAGLSAHAVAWSKKLLPEGSDVAGGLLGRFGAHTVVAAALRAVQLLGRQFVLGRDIGEALRRASAERAPGVQYSYDMLGEGARSAAVAARCHAAYRTAIDAVAGGRVAVSPEASDGISIKLSALFPRFEQAQRARIEAELLPRAWALVEAAARANIHLTIDAEESERLEPTLDVFERLAERVAAEAPQWQGLGLAVQAYQTRALDVVDEVARIARTRGLRPMVRLVKGAYWDAEVQRAQRLGLAGYPVYTDKRHTDVSYLSCARALLDHAPLLYPQFATHNATTIAAVLEMARQRPGARFELQRLHGMGESVHREVARHAPVACRIYAPVGEHRELLAYLVRRLLENGANSSFVRQLADAAVPVDELLASPLGAAPAPPALQLPRALYGPARLNAAGVDLACDAERAPIERAVEQARVGTVATATPADIDRAMARLHAAFAGWAATPLAARAAALRRAAVALEQRQPEFCALLVREAHKTLGDALAEVREAVDLLRYYAMQAEATLAPIALPGPTGELNTLALRGRGVYVCISPWNFSLAIYVGQVAAALVAGNAVAAKPAEQTPYVAARVNALLHAAGVPHDALALLHGAGETVGAALVADARTAGVCFTGSTAVARAIQRMLAAHDGAIVPLVAETGGINAMIVDSTALPEQVVDAIVASAFRSAGQRCSALRLLVVHDAVAEGVLEMLAGAMQELRVGDPASFATDVGPVIDDEAHVALAREIERLRRDARFVAESPPPADALARLVRPVAFEVARIADVQREIFGPVLHVVRWRGDVDAVVDAINALGWGLTLGVHTRIDSRAERIAARARVGNVYVNRDMIGAVVGVQPFGGEGLSGTGPKAGGPHYLLRFCTEQTLTVNVAAAGGNVELLAGAPPHR